MQIKRFFALAMAAVLLISFSGCRNRENENENSGPDISEEDQLVIYHNSTELAPMLMALAEEYSSATGKTVSSKLAGNDFMGEMKSSGAAIYVVDTHADLSDWHTGGMFGDILNDSEFSSVVSGIPSGLQFNPEGIGSYGVPLMLEGYGYIVDKDMLGALFGEENAENLINALKTCSFTEFEGFVAAVDTYISAPSAATVNIGGKEFVFAPEKSGKAASLTGIFSLNEESTRAMEHLLSYGLAAKFAGRYEVMTADETAVSGMEDIVSAYMEVLDLHTSHIAGANGSISRGDEFTGGDYNYSTAVDLFSRGYALFYPGGTSDAADFEKATEGFGKNLDIIPMKLPLSSDDITAAGMTEEKLQSSIVIGSRYYLAVNPKASENLSAAAKDFINWIYDDEAGKKAYSNAFGTVPFNYGYIMNGGTEGQGGAENEGSSESSSEGGSFAENTESGTVSPENAEPSGNAENPGAAGKSKSAKQSSVPEENKDSDYSADENGEVENSGENAADGEGGSFAENMTPSHSISSGLLASVAEYYAKGNWIPDMSYALPADFADEILGKGLEDYWGKETWAEEDRKSFVDTVIEGWKERINKENSAVG